MVVCALIVALIGALWAYFQIGIPQSVSYIANLNPIAWSLWMFSIACLLAPSWCKFCLPLALIGVSGLVMAAASPYYLTDDKILHYGGGTLFCLSASITGVMSCWWVVFFFLVMICANQKTWLFWVETACVLMLIGGLL